MKNRFKLRKDGENWRIYDCQQQKWRGKGKLLSVELTATLNALNRRSEVGVKPKKK